MVDEEAEYCSGKRDCAWITRILFSLFMQRALIERNVAALPPLSSFAARTQFGQFYATRPGG